MSEKPLGAAVDALLLAAGPKNPAAMAISADRASRWAIKEARRRGYVKRTIEEDGHRYLGWVCPHCQKFPPQSA